MTSARGVGLLPPPKAVIATSLALTMNTECILQHTIELLDDLGFERKDFVEHPGDYAHRGGILDVFSCVGENPVRIEFLDDTIDLPPRIRCALATFHPRPDISAHCYPIFCRRILSVRHRRIFPLPSLTTSHRQPLLCSSSPTRYGPQPFRMLRAKDPSALSNAGHAPLSTQFSVYTRALLLKRPLDRRREAAALVQRKCPAALQDLAERLEAGFQVALACDTQAEMSRLKELLDTAREVAEGEKAADPAQVRMAASCVA